MPLPYTMHEKIQRLLAAIDQAIQSESDGVDLPELLTRLPAPGTLPSPWEAWGLIVLMRHRRRQQWVQTMVETRLDGNIAAIGQMGSLGHPEDHPRRGSLPGMSEWEYFFHGCGCCLSHKVNGDAIDVDFHDGSANYFDTYFFEHYLNSLRHAEPPEQRLQQLHPSQEAVSLFFENLRRLGVLVPLRDESTHPLRLADDVVEYEDSIDQFCQKWAREDRLMLAAIIGDWLSADAMAEGEPALQAITGPRAKACVELRRSELRAMTNFRSPDVLRGLADLGDAQQDISAALEGEPSGLTSAAIDIIAQQDDPQWCPAVFALTRRIRPDGQVPQPYIWTRAQTFLLRHQHKIDQVVQSLPDCGGTQIGEGALLALEYAPEHALSLIRKGLRSSIPCNRIDVAALLAVINKPWSRRELLASLEYSNDQALTADARAALLETCNEEAEQAVVAWEKRNPHENEPGTYLEVEGRTVGPFFSVNEVMLRQRGEFVRSAMQEIHDRVMKIRHVIPPEPKS
ncbi:hypothetical protein AB1L30_15815 [Bremerella sp. JC817]